MMIYADRRDDEDRSPVGLIITLIVSILAPIAASLAQLAISRQREYLADISAAKITNYPEGMISALKKLDEHGRPMKRQNTATASMYINNPMKKGFFTKLFSTHPPIEDRIERLENAKHNF
jgi:heat shock protein HtpX